MELLKKLTEFDCPSSREGTVAEFIKEKCESMGYEVSYDGLGSVIAHKKGKGKKLMVAAHIDEIGIIVNYIEDSGFIRFAKVGGLEAKELLKRRVKFNNGTIGVISSEKGFKDKAELDKLYVDIGVKDKAETQEYVKTGDTAVFVGEFHKTGSTVISKALDDRVGCYIMLKAMERNVNSDNDLYYVFTTQEEVGLRGGKTSAFTVKPDYAIAIDVTDTGDTLEDSKMEVKLGGGAAIKIMDRSVMCDRGVVDTLRKLCEDANKVGS